ncbi:MAG: insulinase family protein [Bacteroidales bacterium]
MKKLKCIFQACLILSFLGISTGVFAQKQYTYKTYPNDPLKVREYTLDNGLKVFLSVYKAEPRIQTYIAVRVGSKNDPAQTTGLAHYFEHMMFKGTEQFGTSDWGKEKILIQAIEGQFEVYRNLVDSAARAQAYHIIDSLSYEASKLAIPNEYDKLMSAIGSTGTNAGTSYDFTNYIENIPSNQLETWASIQSDRFSNAVLRLFHTEIETVYEEKNMSLTNDNRKVNEAILSALFPNHPYGKQTVLGSQEHLKNPSMKNLREFFGKYYIPNNFAVVLVGDFNPDEAIVIIDKNFGKLQSKPIPEFTFTPEPPIHKPIVKEVVGLEAENVWLAYRTQGAGSQDALITDLLGTMLYNGKAGLFDLNLNQQQKVMFSFASGQTLVDYGMLMLYAKPKTGQTLVQAHALLLDQLELLKKGAFPEWMLEAAMNNTKYQMLKNFEHAEGRGMSIAYSYLEKVPWEQYVQYIDRLSKITKSDIIEFANKNFNENYVVVYKRQGKPNETAKIQKPAITPIEVNRNIESDFLKTIKEESKLAKTIEPVFIDYKTAISRAQINKNVELLYVKNTENNTFEITYLFDMGKYNDKMLPITFDYLDYLGTSKFTPKEIKEEFYKLACDFSVSTSGERVYVSVSGLSENMEKAVALTESLFKDCQPNAEALTNLIEDELQSRKDAKANQRMNSNALLAYATYGPVNPNTYILSETELKALSPKDIIKKIKSLYKFEHKILYYGSQDLATAEKILNKLHKTPAKLLPVPAPKEFPIVANTEDKVIFAQYDAKQSYCYTLSKGVPFQKELEPTITLFNGYFGGGMNAIVFQEMREKRSLAYNAWAAYITPNKPSECYRNLAFIATQNDKVVDAFKTFNDLFNDMPLSDKAFTLAKDAEISALRTQRFQNTDIFWAYLRDMKYGYTDNSRKIEFEVLPTITLQDIKAFNEKYIKNHKKVYTILGNEADFDFAKFEKEFGKVEKVSQETIFGY